MSMQALNQLVARSIIDPSIVQAFSTDRFEEILGDLDFSSELKSKLASLTANTWAEFSIMAYRLVQAAESVQPRIQLPSPAEGLLLDGTSRDKEQVA